MNFIFNTQISIKAKLHAESLIKSKSKMNLQSKSKSSRPGILMKGWIKYMEIIPSAPSQEFFVNQEYARTLHTIAPAEKEKQDQVGYIEIPDENSFYFVLTTTTLNILSSRRNMITQTVSVIDLNIIDKISLINDNGTESYKGGLEIMGDFDEGKCFKLNLNDGHS